MAATLPGAQTQRTTSTRTRATRPRATTTGTSAGADSAPIGIRTRGGASSGYDPLSSAPRKDRATGGIDLVTGPTSFLAGEAGNEAVVVLRNPRMNGAPGGLGRGGSGPISISVNVNASVSGEADEDRMVRKVVRALHDEVAMLVG